MYSRYITICTTGWLKSCKNVSNKNKLVHIKLDIRRTITIQQWHGTFHGISFRIQSNNTAWILVMLN